MISVTICGAACVHYHPQWFKKLILKIRVKISDMFWLADDKNEKSLFGIENFD